MKKELISRKINNDISLIIIEHFNIESWYDTNVLKNIFKSLFSNEETIFFSFRREEDLTDERRLKQLKGSIFETFKKAGDYVILKKLDESRFDSVARISINDDVYELLIDIWKYFYSCAFFKPLPGLSFSDFIDFQKSIKFIDKGGEKLISNNYSNFECIKGLGGDHLLISYKNNYSLPDFKKIISESPDFNQIFK